MSSVRHPGNPDNYPHLLATAIRTLSATEPRLRVADAGAALTTDDHSFTNTLPGPLGTCIGYSAGARRFGEAMADAAIAANHAPRSRS